MILNSQDSLIARGYPYDKLFKALNQALINGELARVDLSPAGKEIGEIYAVYNSENIPAFNIPLKTYDVQGRPFYCIDLRSVSMGQFNINPANGRFKPKLMTEANFLLNVALAQRIWNNNLSAYAPIYYDACRVYALWIATKIAKKLVLTLPQQTDLTLKFAYFFITRTNSVKVLEDGDYDLIVNRIAYNFGYQPTEVYTALDDFGQVVFSDIEAFCKEIRETSDNPKLNRFNYVLLQTILTGSWFGGTNVKEIIALAVEYPPVFLTLLYRAFSERTYKDTEISRLALRIIANNNQRNYMRLFASLLAAVS